MKNSLVKKGLILLLISIIYRIIAFAFLSVSWQWPLSPLVRGLEAMTGILFMVIWFVYGLTLRLGFTKGLIVGLIGVTDAIALTIISLIFYLNRGSYYFGPIEMSVWNIPLMGINNLIIIPSWMFTYLMPIIAILLTGFGSVIRKDRNVN